MPVVLSALCTARNALLMNALSTPSHLPSRQDSGRSASVAEEERRSVRQAIFNQQVGC